MREKDARGVGARPVLFKLFSPSLLNLLAGWIGRCDLKRGVQGQRIRGSERSENGAAGENADETEDAVRFGFVEEE